MRWNILRDYSRGKEGSIKYGCHGFIMWCFTVSLFRDGTTPSYVLFIALQVRTYIYHFCVDDSSGEISSINTVYTQGHSTKHFLTLELLVTSLSDTVSSDSLN